MITWRKKEATRAVATWLTEVVIEAVTVAVGSFE
jgi:hypothetical protein